MSELDRTPAEPEPEPEPEPPRPGWRRRLAPLILIGGLLAAGSVVLPHVPRERQIEVRLEDAASVVRLDLSWSDPGAGDSAALQGSSFRFAPGSAPPSLVTTVRLPDGPYALEITVNRTLGRDLTRRTIILDDADRVTVPVR